jgi:tetratricopeptide (TPR) repeat protein
MGKKQSIEKDGYVKKQTLTLAILVALSIGFFGGVVFTVYKSGSSQSAQVSAKQIPAPTNPTRPDVSTDTAVEMLKLEKITSQNPDDESAWVELGNLYFDSSNYQKAIEAYNKSLALNPNNANVITDLGIMYRRSGQPDEAVKTFDKAIKVEPKHETARFNKGIVLMHDLKDIEGAIKAWEELIALNPVAMSPNGQSVDQILQTLKERK